MKGLLLKDFFMTVRYCRAYLLLVLLFSILSVFANNIFLILYPIMIAGIVPVNLISYDEKSRWHVYSGTLPYTRMQIVSEKYIMALLFLGIGFLLIAGAQAAGMLRQGTFYRKEYLRLLAVLPVLGLFSPCLMLPVIFRYGVEKGRLFYYAVIALVCGAFGMIGAAGVDGDMQSLLAVLDSRITFLMPVAAVLMLAVSWLLSIRFYQRRDL